MRLANRPSIANITTTAVVVALFGNAVHAKPFAKATHGKPDVKSVDVIGFGPEGTLLIGDGRGAAIFAVATGEKPSQQQLTGQIDDIAGKLAATVGAKADGIEILDLAVNPVSGTAYFAVRKQDDKQPLILTLRAEGSIGLFALDSVEYARVQLKSEAPISRITDVAWADDKLIAGAGASEEFASKIFVIQTPLTHDATGDLHSAETYHVSHRKWETRAPMSTIMPFAENGKTYVAGAFACTPVVKYPLDSLQPGAKVKGISVIELGSGNRPLDMFTYTKDGKEYVLSNTFRFHHERKPFGPSPYWTVRFERELLGEEENVNEKALNRLKGYEPATPRIVLVETYHGVRQMDRLGESDALVLRESPDRSLQLAVLPLP
jgi:hypothetical protein